MSESKMVTEREAVIRERAAYVAGMHNARGSDEQQCRGARWGVESMAEEAARLYPLPKVERPRVVTDHDAVTWRVVDGRIEWRWLTSKLQWEALKDPDQYFGLTTERVKLLADLLANPTELVEDTP